MAVPTIQTTNLEQTFTALRNQDPMKMMDREIPFSPDYKSIPKQNLAPTSSANTGSWGNGMAKFASGVVYGQPQFFSPVHTPINWQIPSKRLEQYQWARFFYENEPKVASSIDFYSSFPMNDFTNECKDRSVRSYFDKFKRRLDIPKWTRLMSHEVHLLGDCFPFVEVSCSHCFPADTMVLTNNGHKSIRDVEVDDLVLTISGEYCPVIKTMSFKYRGDMVEIKRQSLPSIKSTSDHMHYIVKPEYRNDNKRVKSADWNNPILVQAKDIKEGDYISAPFNDVLPSDIKEIVYDGAKYRFKNKKLAKKKKIKLDDGFASLMGWYVAEGSTDSNRTFHFSLNCEKEAEVGEKIKTWIEDYFEQGSDIKEFWTRNVRQVVGYSRELSAWFDNHCGHGSVNKKIPYFIMRGSRSVKQSFLNAYLEGDGCPRKSKNVNTLSTISKTLCYDLIALLSDLGYSCYVDEKEECIDGLGIHRCHCYRINYRIDEKRKNGQGTYKEKRMAFFKVKGVISNKEDTTVYNMTVDKDHSYVANYCYTKNCGGSGRIGDEICEHEGGTVKRIVILNPDYVEVYTSPLNPDPIIALKPDEELINMVQKKTPGYEKLTPEVIKLISSGQPIRLDNRNVFHLKYGEGGYSKYGVGMVRRLFPILSYKTKLMVAQWIVAERLIVPIKIVKVGSDERPAGPADIAAVQAQLAQTANDPNLTIVTHHAFELDWIGACHDEETEVLTENGWKKYSEVSKGFDENIATYNLENGNIEYQIPQEYHEYDYDGELCTFTSKHYDIAVTPNHKMLTSLRKWNQKEYKYDHGDFKPVKADNVIENSRFLSSMGWEGEIPLNLPYKGNDYLNKLSLDDYLRFVGYYVSEGGLKIDKGIINSIHITQKQDSPCFEDICSVMNKISSKVQMSEDDRSTSSCCQLIINDSKFARQIPELFGKNSQSKAMPKWILNLPKRELGILMGALMDGDGNVAYSYGGAPKFKYTTVSPVLADQVQEIVMKMGYCPKKSISIPEIQHHKVRYDIFWSEEVKNRGFVSVKERNIGRKTYNGKVWCFTVSNGYFITRRNGKITVQGNSGKVLTLSNEFEFINQEILDGMMINNALLNGEGPNFSAAAVGIEAMIERLETFRREVGTWIEESIYKPESLRQGFIEQDEDSQEEELIYPTVKWNSMHLRDQQQHRTFMIQLYEKGLVSAQTVLETFDLDPDQEIERKRYDAVQMMALGQGMGQMGGGDAGGGMMGGDMGGGMPPMPGGDMGGGMPGGDMGGAPIAPGGDMGAPAMASSNSRLTIADPQNYGGKVLTKKTRERLDRENSKVYQKQQKASEQQGTPGQEMRDNKGRIIFTKPERQLMDQLMENQKSGLIKYPIAPQYEIAHVTGQNYLIDFAIPSLKIGIEADGEAFHSSPKQEAHDKERDMNLAQSGWTILRFSDSEIEKVPERVIRTIIQNVMQKEMMVQEQQEQLKKS